MYLNPSKKANLNFSKAIVISQLTFSNWLVQFYTEPDSVNWFSILGKTEDKSVEYIAPHTIWIHVVCNNPSFSLGLSFLVTSWDLKVLKIAFYFKYDTWHRRKLNSGFIVLHSASICSINRRMNLNVFCYYHSDKQMCWNTHYISFQIQSHA